MRTVKSEGVGNSLTHKIIAGFVFVAVLSVLIVGSRFFEENLSNLDRYLHLQAVHLRSSSQVMPDMWAYHPGPSWPYLEEYRLAVAAHEAGDDIEATRLLGYIPNFGCRIVAMGNDAYLGLSFANSRTFYQSALRLPIDDCQAGTLLLMYNNLCKSPDLIASDSMDSRRLSWCQKAAEKYPGYITFMDWGIAQYKDRDFNAAVVSFQRALAYTPNSPNALMWLGLVYTSMGDLASARRAYTDGLANAPDHAGLNLEMGKLALEHGETEAAQCYLERAMQDDGIYGKAAASILEGIEEVTCTEK